jgi:hypothetical protein
MFCNQEVERRRRGGISTRLRAMSYHLALYEINFGQPVIGLRFSIESGRRRVKRLPVANPLCSMIR